MTGTGEANYRPMSDDEKVALQQVILPIIATRRDGSFTAVGTGFVICVLGRQALMLSAAHVLRQVITIDRPHNIHHSSTPPEFLVTKAQDTPLKQTRMWALYRESLSKGHLAEILVVYINDPLDIALCTVSFSDDVPEHVAFLKKLTIDSSPPKIGMPIIAAGYGDMRVDQNNLGSEQGGATARLNFQLDYRHGTILDTFPNGQPWPNPWPSFQIDTPISSGMSGGPVINKTYGDIIVACGINMFDRSTASNGSASGQNAIAAMLWPCMGIAIKHAEINGESKPVRLIDLVAKGFINDRGNAPKHLGPLPDPATDRFPMKWHP